MRRHTQTRIRNRFIYPVLGLFEAIWRGLVSLFKSLPDGIETTHENDLFRP